jgi:hypothetical protein
MYSEHSEVLKNTCHPQCELEIQSNALSKYCLWWQLVDLHYDTKNWQRY